MSNLDKKAIINMENTARYQTRSKLNIAFSTADRESAVFVFNITKGSKPLLLSSENVTGHIALKHNDGSFVKDTLHFTEPDINGRLEYYIPNEMLKRQGTVTMQVFISEKGNSNVTVAERIVTFDIEKSIVSQISAETKLQYIVEYDELQAIIANRITDIENNMANAEDYVSQLEQAKEKGLSDIEIAKQSALDNIESLATKKTDALVSKGDAYSTKFDSDIETFTIKKQEFDQSVQDSNVVTTGTSTNWQKFAITDSTGAYNRVDLSNSLDELYALNNGVYYVVNTPGLPTSATHKNGFISVMSRNDKTLKRLNFMPFNSAQLFSITFFENNWSNWTNLTENLETTTESQAKANTAEGNANTYTNTQINSLKTILFSGSATGMNTVIDLVDDYNKYTSLTVYGDLLDTDFVLLANPSSTKSIFLKPNNVTDSDGNGAQMYEARLEKTTTKKLTIKNDVFYDVKNDIGSGANANKITVNKIVGWK